MKMTMDRIYIDFMSGRLSVAPWRVEHCVGLLEEGATVPFISRYRKERTGGLDEAQVSEIKHYYLGFVELEKRKESILSSIGSQGKLDAALEKEIRQAVDPKILEDLYLPFRPKRKTRASVARDCGLEPLAAALFGCKVKNPAAEAEAYLSDKVKDVQAALSGASDIIAEWVSESVKVREYLRRAYMDGGRIVSSPAKGVDTDSEEAMKYRNYMNRSEPLSKIPSHRALAVLRASSEGVLSVKVEVDRKRMTGKVFSMVMRDKPQPSRLLWTFLSGAVEDSFSRLLHPSIENQVLKEVKERADIEAVKVFGENLRQLLMAPALGQRRVMAIDPGFRTGCKVVCLDAQGALLHNDTIYPHPPRNERTMAMKKIANMVQAYGIEVIAIGNGTAGRETEAFIRKLALPDGVKAYSVSEDGASVYSASDIAREEFPQYDVTVRGAVSIGRRLMDPLAELVKIDPKSLGVGQYQHDVDQALLKERLDSVVESCVNMVGVNLNTASPSLLSYVSGIGPALAKNIVEYREANGAFASRSDILKVKRVGDKVFEQCAGFLRIPGAADPLDNTAVHPERYALVEEMARDAGADVPALISDKALRDSVDLSRYVSDGVGMMTLNDIMSELARPGRDPRESFRVLEFSDDIRTLEDLSIGQELPGIVTNITDFGAFVDIGIKRSGLIHVSRMLPGRRGGVRPSDVLKVHQHVKVRVVEIDLERGRIGLELVAALS